MEKAHEQVIEVSIYPTYVYLDGVRISSEELEQTFKELYSPIAAKYRIGFT